MSNLVVGRIEFGDRFLGVLPRANDNIDVRQFGARGSIFQGAGKPTELVGERCNDIGVDHPQMFADVARGPFIQVYPARKFYPFSPRPEDVFIESIAHGLANICRYSGAVDRHYSVAEHSTLIARYLAARYDSQTALAGLLHDAPESLSGFGDVGRPVKGRAPIIGETEDLIYRQAVAPRFGLPLDLPWPVHEADTRIIADEIAANLAPMDWQDQYGDPLGVRIRCWSPAKAEVEFLATFEALTGRARGE